MDRRDMRLASMGMRLLGQWLHLLVSAAVIFGLAYLLGHTLLADPLKGNDRPLHVAYTYWLNQYFPNIPHWYPPQGGGQSILHGYPLLSHIFVVVIHRVSDLSIEQAGGILGFMSFPLTAIGIYLFCWTALRNQTVGLIAAVLFLLSPLTWTWLHDWGFFAYAVGMAFLPPALICFDRHLAHLQREHGGRGARLWFLGAVLAVALGGLVHPVIGAASMAGMLLYTLPYSLLRKPGTRLVTLKKGLLAILASGALVGLLIAFYVVPFYRYGVIANREGLNLLALDQIPHLPIAEFFGLRPIDPLIIHTRMGNALVVTVFFAIGLLMSARYSLKAFALILGALLAAIYSLRPEFSYALRNVSSSLAMVFGLRSTISVVMILFPVGAAFGAWALARALLSPTSLLRRKSPSKTGAYQPRLSLHRYASPAVALGLVGAAILPLGEVFSLKADHVSYGPLPHGINLADLWGQWEVDGSKDLLGQLALDNWPPFALGDGNRTFDDSQELASLLPEERPLRIDISPYQGRLAEYFAQYSGTSQIESYSQQLSLIHLMWGYQLGVFYSDESGSPEALNNLADWMGIRYVFLNPSLDPIAKYEAAGWELVSDDGDIQVRSYAAGLPMATASTRPAILVVGAPDKAVYANVFRMATEGLAPYDEFLLMEGSGRIDQYSLEELQRFDILFLHGYQYSNGRRAWGLLEEYVRGGGSLFVDTGWQYEVPEWEFEQAPQVLPVSTLAWTNYGKESNYQLGNPEIAGDVDTAQFGPLAWGEDPWSVSGASRDDLRDWGRPILSTQGHPLIVSGELGDGRVVWSGMNLIAHLISYDSKEESRLLHNILGWLSEEAASSDTADPSVVREHPDRIEFSLGTVPGDTTWLYWREAFYPNWHAYIVNGEQRSEIPIYRGGPGFMLMPIETAASEAHVILQWEPALVERLAVIVSLGATVLLVLLVLDGIFLEGRGFYRLRDFIRESAPRPFLGDGPIHDWVERKRAEINGDDAPAPEWNPYPEPSVGSRATSPGTPQVSMRARGDGRDRPGQVPDLAPQSDEGKRLLDLESPADSAGTTKHEISPPDWLRRLNEQEGKGAGEILSRRRLRKS